VTEQNRHGTISALTENHPEPEGEGWITSPLRVEQRDGHDVITYGVGYRVGAVAATVEYTSVDKAPAVVSRIAMETSFPPGRGLLRRHYDDVCLPEFRRLAFQLLHQAEAQQATEAGQILLRRFASLTLHAGKQPRDDLELLPYAEAYVEALAKTPKSIYDEMQKQFSARHTPIYLRKQVGECRKRGLLTSHGPRKKGGELTPKALSLQALRSSRKDK
jgi:hypothetical protein